MTSAVVGIYYNIFIDYYLLTFAEGLLWQAHFKQHNPAKVGTKSCRFSRECICLICACTDVPTRLELCLYDQTQIIANAPCRVGSQQFLY